MTVPVHPGEQIKLDMDDLGLNTFKLSKILGVPFGYLQNILDGHQGLLEIDCRRLAAWSGTSVQYWLNLQSNYEKEKEEQRVHHQG